MINKHLAYVRCHFSQRCYQRLGYVISQEFLIEERNKGNLKQDFVEDNGRIRYYLKRKNGNNGKGYIVIFDPSINLFVTIFANGVKKDNNQNKENKNE